MRRFLLLVSCVVVVDTSLYSALTPLLPQYADRFDLSRTGAGVLLACYGAGVLLAALPTGVWASRFGPKNVVLAGLAVIALSSFAFAFADSAWTLGAARFAQGLGSAATWAGSLAWLVATLPAERRGQTIGTAMGAAVFGTLIGPALGAIADFGGTRATFAGLGVVVMAMLLAAARLPGSDAEPQRLLAALPAFRERRLLAGLWVTVLPALLFGTFALVVSFRLHDAGWRSSEIAAVFLGAAALETVMNPLLGRLVDHRGHRMPIRAALVASIGFALALAWVSAPGLLAPLAILGAVAFGALYSPGMAMISQSAEHAGLAQGIAFGVMNGAWAVGNMVGPAAAGAISQATGDPATWLVCAGLCTVTLAGLRLRGARATASE